jgi:hypothetical protein
MNIQCSHDELLPIHKIIPNPKNPNKHPEKQITRLAQLIEYQGQRHPIIISKRSGFVVVGHGRLEAIKKLGWEKAAVNFQEFENEAQEYAFVVSDNAISEWAELDLAKINQDIIDIGPDLDIDLLGIDNFTIEPLEKIDDEMTEKLKDDMNKKYVIEVTFPNDMEMMDIHDDLSSRGYIVKVKS